MSIRFWLNGEPCTVEELSPTTTLLRFLRDHRNLGGTKEGCAEGDCGACTVAVLEPTPDGSAAFRAVNSCLLLLPMVQGKQVFTVEGIREAGQPHPAQEVLAKNLGSQCGYCTPGVVMSLFEACYRPDLDEPWKLDAQMCGNLCRCTGYRPIRDSAKQLAGLQPEDRFRALARSASAEPMALSYATPKQIFRTPASLDELWAWLPAHPDARFVVGGTDLSLEVTKRYAEPPSLVSLEGIPELRVLREEPGSYRIGATATLTEVEDFFPQRLPPLERMARYFGARQIKNRATVGGNLCNASPIGDLAPVLLALDATVVLLSREGSRSLPLDQFFLGYRKTALRPGEILGWVEVPKPGAAVRACAYKVSKRRELDISTVAAGFAVELGPDRMVTRARLAYGGMAATPARARKAEAELVGKPWSEPSLSAAVAALAQDFSPISDHRGSAAYRLRLAQNLLRGFFEETQGERMPRLVHPHSATVQVS